MRMSKVHCLLAGAIVLAAIAVSPPSPAAQQNEAGVTAAEAIHALAYRVQSGQLKHARDITDALRWRCILGVKTVGNTIVSIDTLDRMIRRGDASEISALGAQDLTFVRDAGSPSCAPERIARQGGSRGNNAGTPPPPPPPPPPTGGSGGNN